MRKGLGIAESWRKSNAHISQSPLRDSSGGCREKERN
jgi:hypothetical protein